MRPEKRDSGHPEPQNTGSGPPVSPTSKKKARRTYLVGGRSISLPAGMQPPLLATESRTADAIIGHKQKRKRTKKGQ